MSGILDVRSFRQARREFRWDALWGLFVGDRRRLNIATECLDRHAGTAIALCLKFADGHREEHTFGELAAWSSRFASWLESEGVEAGDRVAIMLDPALAFYGALFGVIKRGAIAVPLFTLFGPDGLAPRVVDCRPRMLLVPPGTSRWGELPRDVRVVTVDQALVRRVEGMSAAYVPTTCPDDISAGWTMSAVEIEDTLLTHPMVREAAVIGVPDPVRGQIPKAYIVSTQRDPDIEREIREYVKARLSKHEYPEHRVRGRAAEDASREDRPEEPARP